MNYTKGEWYIEKTYGIPEIRTKERRIAKPLYHMGSEDREVEGNAQLMVASPLMYEALRELVELKRIKDTYGKTTDYLARQPNAWKAVEQAILKAEGKGE